MSVYLLLIIVIGLAALLAPSQPGMMNAQELQKENRYQDRMLDIANNTEGCLTAESYTEHFEDKELARETLNQLQDKGNMTEETETKGIFDSRKVYCPGEIN